MVDREPLTVGLGLRDGNLGPFFGAPAHLADALRRWIVEFVPDLLARDVGLRVRVPGVVDSSTLAKFAEDMQLIDVVDDVLRAHVSEYDPTEVMEREVREDDLFIGGEDDVDRFDRALRELRHLLKSSGSAYEMAPDGDGLRPWLDPTIAAAAERAMSQASGDPQLSVRGLDGLTPAERSARHLRGAWEAAYSVSPDPAKAYSLAVKAVEAIAIPSVPSKRNPPTLGTVQSTLYERPDDWMLPLRTSDSGHVNGEVVHKLISVLWFGQHDRHGDRALPVELPEARTAVGIAVLLVQLFVSGAVTRRLGENS